ncbi:MAG: GtrA family protein [Taibaiella sp.]|nr:GtrA family protein [Taibaiella sp.]
MKEKLKQSRTLKSIRRAIFSMVDFFYPPFKRWIPLKTFRYAFCGGSVALLNLLVVAFSNQFIMDERAPVDIGILRMQYYTVSFIIAFCVSFPVGFILNKYIVFQASNLKGRVQLFRYFSMNMLNILLNYLLLHLFVGIWGFWPTPSQAAITLLLAILSYFVQNFFSFREKKEDFFIEPDDEATEQPGN